MMRTSTHPTPVGIAILVTGFLALCFQNCGEPLVAKNGIQKSFQGLMPIDFRLESKMSERLKATIRDDLGWYHSRKGLEGVRSDSYEQKIFGADIDGHMAYLGARIKFGLEGQPAEEDGLIYLAQNPSVLMWFEGLANGQYRRFNFDGQSIVINSSRAGTVVFNAYADLPDRFERVATLVHEARHSDCTGGLPASFVPDIERFFANEVDTPNIACGHLHDFCPTGHSLSGLIACDSHLWGAYSVAAHLGKVFYQHCNNCSEEDRQIANIVAADSFSRVIQRGQISNKTAASPDLSSSGVIEGM